MRKGLVAHLPRSVVTTLAIFRSHACALEPGAGGDTYGFLSENADFAQACIDAGLTFVGPKPKIIRQMGSKIAAKSAAEAAGIPVVPGYHLDGASDLDLTAGAKRVGVPLLIKASAGGGGRAWL